MRWAILGLAAGVLATAGALYLYQDQRLPAAPGFHERDCWFSTRNIGAARCGYMVVPENRQRAESRTIRLPVVILKAAQGDVRREPILYLDGGPGGRAYLDDQVEIDSWIEMRKVFPPGHDLILLGQRGTGRSAADFDCPELKTAALSLGAHAPTAEPPDVRALSIRAAAACSRRLLAEGVDLTAYNSRESAADIAELRQALGIESWTLYGISYGTRIALSVLRYRPEGVRAVILDSVVAPQSAEGLKVADFYRDALNWVLKDCPPDTDCAGSYRDQRNLYNQARAQMAERPLIFELADFLDAEELAAYDGDETDGHVVTLDHRFFDLLLLDAVMDPEAALLVPALLHDITTRRYVILKARLRETLRLSTDYDSSISWAVYLSHVCHDEAPFQSPEAIAEAAGEAGDLGYMIEDHWPNYLCSHWPAGAADAVENTPVVSAVPALLLAGRFDPLTPPVLAQQAAETLANGHVFTFAELGHGVLVQSPCAWRLTAQFLEHLKRPSAGRCSRGVLVNPGSP
ncbi:alpha/beta hydrolase [Pelagibius sp.]|uniref:alpha/beta hydrolase n=1 Tax=Pelagibius sp. TaxID=1931238 RepID=UPI003BAE47C6